MKRVKINFEDYNKLCQIAIEKGKPVEETLMDLLEISGQYDVEPPKSNTKKKSKEKLKKQGVEK